MQADDRNKAQENVVKTTLKSLFYALVLYVFRPLYETMFGLFTSCISMVSLIAHYGAKLYYLKKVKASMQQVRINRNLFTDVCFSIWQNSHVKVVRDA